VRAFGLRKSKAGRRQLASRCEVKNMRLQEELICFLASKYLVVIVVVVVVVVGICSWFVWYQWEVR
jgi:ATP/ADP translocase